MKISAADYPASGQPISGLVVGKGYLASASVYSDSLRASLLVGADIHSSHQSWATVSQTNTVEDLSCFFIATATTVTVWCGKVMPFVGWTSGDLYVDNISVREIPGHHMLQATSAARPLLSAYDGQTLGPGNTYDATGYPIFQKYDGTDDGMATASFAAGTLINGMDCMIPVRRDSGANMICGLYEPGRGNAYFGAVSDGSTSTCMGPDVGYSWTILVDGTLLAGGTSVTQGQLSNALTVGEFHILEFRNIELNSLQKLAFGMYGAGWQFNGARGDILLFPSTASTEDKDKARQYLADKYGVTLA
jgi:hypothetical protein